MFGVGPAPGPQLMAEIGDVHRFYSKKALVAYAGIDAPTYQSGTVDIRSRSISKTWLQFAAQNTYSCNVSATVAVERTGLPIYG